VKPVPFAQRQRRLPEAGRIRLGVKTTAQNGKVKPTSIDRFRFTSQSRVEIEAIAEQYGGKVGPWSDPKAPPGQWEVITDAHEIPVVLPPNPLGDGPTYEKWGGRGRERLCDGITMEVVRNGPEGPEPAEEDCYCARRGIRPGHKDACKPKLRLNVILPDLRFTGTWRLETSSDLACDEIPGMVDLLLEQQDRGLVCGLLRVEHRWSQGGHNRFVVPALGLSESLLGLVSGRARLGALPGAEPAVPALNAGSADQAGSAPAGPGDGHGAQGDPATSRGAVETPVPGADLDDEVIDAEVILSLDEMIAELDQAGRAALTKWWRVEAKLPDRADLTPEQEQAVVDHLKGLAPPS
jgi:hypothetical protein